MRTPLSTTAAAFALLVAISACSGGGETQATPATSAVIEVDESSAAPPEPVESTTSTSTTSTSVAPPVDLPEWVLALPIEVHSAAQPPESLAFAEEYRDPGLNYRITPGPTWERNGSGGEPTAPVTEWVLDSGRLVRVRATSASIWNTPFDEFVIGLSGEVLYQGEDRAVVSETIFEESVDLEFTVLRLFIHEVDRIAMVNFSYPTELGTDPLQDALPYLMTAERTPYDGTDAGSAPPDFVDQWRVGFESMPADELAATGRSIDELAACVADGLLNERLARYTEEQVDLDAQIGQDGSLSLTYGNFLADQEEILAFCGLPPYIFGTTTE